ncbi:MAG: CDP-alcohol phosphatidyltransferase family protein [Eubacteriales bacterium]|nr:CDP-alcohol phosphatidyltransferase family protein [Eubacteriales bacterium]
MIADIITISRILFSVLLLFFPPSSSAFALCYLLCGATDVLDGFAARKLQTESEKGAMLDSAADLFFAVIYAVRILPLLSVPLWIWIWTAIITVIKVIGIMIVSKKTHGLLIEHSFGNKLTGLLLFFLPLSTYLTDVKYGAIIVCVIATLTAIKETINYWGEKNAV